MRPAPWGSGRDPIDAERWIRETVASDVDGGWTRAELAEHVRDERSTYTWRLQPMIARAGLEIVDAACGASGMPALHLARSAR